MEILFSPWRSEYIDSFKNEGDSDCFLCNAARSVNNDEELLVTARFEHCFCLLNRYPYNSGHLLIAPYVHAGSPDELPDEVFSDLMIKAKLAVKAIDKVMKPHGYNIGINLGRTAGAGVPGHIHLHVVPRWNGDSNFMASVADTKVVSQSLARTREDFARTFKELSKEAR